MHCSRGSSGHDGPDVACDPPTTWRRRWEARGRGGAIGVSMAMNVPHLPPSLRSSRADGWKTKEQRCTCLTCSQWGKGCRCTTMTNRDTVVARCRSVSHFPPAASPRIAARVPPPGCCMLHASAAYTPLEENGLLSCGRSNRWKEKYRVFLRRITSESQVWWPGSVCGSSYWNKEAQIRWDWVGFDSPTLETVKIWRNNTWLPLLCSCVHPFTFTWTERFSFNAADMLLMYQILESENLFVHLSFFVVFLLMMELRRAELKTKKMPLGLCHLSSYLNLLALAYWPYWHYLKITESANFWGVQIRTHQHTVSVLPMFQPRVLFNRATQHTVWQHYALDASVLTCLKY